MRTQRSQPAVMRTMRRVTRAALCAALFTAGHVATAYAQYNTIGRGPNINVGPRMPNINPSAGTTHTPSIHYSPQVRYGEKDGDAPPPPPRRPKTVAPANGGDPPPQNTKGRRAQPASVANRNFIPNEVVIEVDGRPTDAEADDLARRHRLTRVESQSFDITGTTMFRWRIPDSRSVASVVQELQADGNVRSVQPNFRFTLQQAAQAKPSMPSQYVAAKLRLTEAHTLAHGDGVLIAVIDSGIDVGHPELSGVIAGTFDALKSDEKPHVHGTGIAGAIAARARLTGSAPSARILAIRAFGATGGSAESSTFNILRSLEFAVSKGAQIINMSFAGPQDRLLARALEGAAKKGIVLIAAAGNAGPKSPPLFPAADPNVIAVSATDANDRIFTASNRGGHVAIAAPGVDVLVPAPDGKYQVTSGTSFAAAYVSGLAALMIERKPDITATALRDTLMATARDLGPRGRDDQYGAGIADALSAVVAAGRQPVTEISARPGEDARR